MESGVAVELFLNDTNFVRTILLGPMEMWKVLRIILVLSVGCLLAYVGYLAWSFYYGVEAERSPFLPAAWKNKANVYAHNSDPGCVRGGMALDIVATNLIQGKSITEVQSLLGEPYETRKSGIRYELGQCSGHGWHSTVLQVNISSNQQVTNAVILRDLP